MNLDQRTLLGRSLSGATDAVTSTTIDAIVTLTQSEYDTLPEPDPATLYVVVE